jgi:hypothetical protein
MQISRKIPVCFFALLLMMPESNAQEQAADSRKPFSPFSFGQVLSLGFSLSYFHYNEDISLSENIQAFSEHFGREPQVRGTPKSTEYGTDAGIILDGIFYSWENHLFLRPRAELILGLGNTYDGSTQEQPIIDAPGDTTGFQFYSIKGNKNNFLFFAGCDLGYEFPFLKSAFVIYAGFDYTWWYRDLTFSQNNTIFFGAASTVETYTRYAIPVGILCTKPISPDVAIGFDARMDWMFFGQMKQTINPGSNEPVINFPTVTLGNRPQFRLDLFLQKKYNDQVSVKYSPYILFYGFGKSNTDAIPSAASQNLPGNQEVFFEPSSNTIMAGITVSLNFLKNRFR